MLLTSLRTCTLTDVGLAWYGRCTQAVATSDLDAFSAMLHPDCAYQFNNQLPFYGSRTIAAALERYRATYKAVEYEPLNIMGDDLRFAVDTSVTNSARTASVSLFPPPVPRSRRCGIGGPGVDCSSTPPPPRDDDGIAFMLTSATGVEAQVTYGVQNGATEVVQCADRDDQGLITSVRVYGKRCARVQVIHARQEMM
jgi:SnoaL-like domain